MVIIEAVLLLFLYVVFWFRIRIFAHNLHHKLLTSLPHFFYTLSMDTSFFFLLLFLFYTTLYFISFMMCSIRLVCCWESMRGINECNSDSKCSSIYNPIIKVFFSYYLLCIYYLWFFLQIKWNDLHLQICLG